MVSPFSYLDLGGAPMNVAHCCCPVYRTLDTQSLTPFTVLFLFLRIPPALFLFLYRSFPLLCPGSSFHCSVLLPGAPVFCLCCDVTTFRRSFQLTHSSIRISSRFLFTSHHQQSPLKFPRQYLLHDRQYILVAEPKQRNLIPGTFQVC